MNSSMSASVGCPHDAVCQTCPCAGEDDACFPGERLRADLHQVHLNYHHMVDVAQRYREALEGITRWFMDKDNADHWRPDIMARAALDDVSPGEALRRLQADSAAPDQERRDG